MRPHPVPNGGAAYSIWFDYNDGDAEYSDAMETVELDLELITGVKGEVYAYRSTNPNVYRHSLNEVVHGSLPQTLKNCHPPVERLYIG
jgi:hypothetical protein